MDDRQIGLKDDEAILSRMVNHEVHHLLPSSKEVKRPVKFIHKGIPEVGGQWTLANESGMGDCPWLKVSDGSTLW